jgi:23S rRNA pseudouridine955/2504/2580 synthase
MKRIEVLYEDEFCLVLNKPAGLAVQGGKGVHVSLDSILAETCSPRPLLTHRLDRDTSGGILAAKSREAAARFSGLLREAAAGGKRRVIKQYLAVCAGRLPAGEGCIRFDLEVRGRVKQSETRYRLLAEGDGFSLAELELGTGRMHQIRRHLAMTGCPIAGDDKYGDFSLNKRLRKTMGLKRLLLHASRLVIPAGEGAAPIDVRAPLPDYFAAFLEQAGIAWGK